MYGLQTKAMCKILCGIQMGKNLTSPPPLHSTHAGRSPVANISHLGLHPQLVPDSSSPGQLAIPCAMFPKEQEGGERSQGLLDLELPAPRCGRCSSHLSGHVSGPFLGFSIPGGKPVGWGQGEVSRPTLLSLCPALPPPASGSGDQASPALL